jgi:hypothetical protein
LDLSLSSSTFDTTFSQFTLFTRLYHTHSSWLDEDLTVGRDVKSIIIITTDQVLALPSLELLLAAL